MGCGLSKTRETHCFLSAHQLIQKHVIQKNIQIELTFYLVIQYPPPPYSIVLQSHFTMMNVSHQFTGSLKTEIKNRKSVQDEHCSVGTLWVAEYEPRFNKRVFMRKLESQKAVKQFSRIHQLAHENLGIYYNWYRVKESPFVYFVSEYYEGLSAEKMLDFKMEKMQRAYLTMKMLLACARGYLFLLRNGVGDAMISIKNLVITKYGEVKIVNHCVAAAEGQKIANTLRSLLEQKYTPFEPKLFKKISDFLPLYEPNKLCDEGKLEKLTEMLKSEERANGFDDSIYLSGIIEIIGSPVDRYG